MRLEKLCRFVSGAALAAGLAVSANSVAAQAPAAGTLAVCPVGMTPATGTGNGQMRGKFLPSVHSKSSAILGGAPSALERMRLQQAGAASIEPAVGRVANPQAQMAAGVKIAACQPATTAKLSGLITPSTQPVASYARTDRRAEDFLSSRRISIGRTTFDNDWQRVRSSGLSQANFNELIGSPRSGVALLEQINLWANRNIRYVEDRENWGQGDYWASAKTTLSTRRGDCEDIAIAKMHLLAAAGVRREDMFLTIVRDTYRNADHAVLIVKQGQGWAMLDNNSDRVLDGRYFSDYRPILSYSGEQSWLHGY